MFSLEGDEEFALECIEGAFTFVQRNRSRIAESRFFNTLQRSATAKKFSHERRFLRCGCVFVDPDVVRIRHSRSHHHHALRTESQLDVEQVPKAVQKKARGNHQYQRKREFGYDQRLARPSAFARAS